MSKIVLAVYLSLLFSGPVFARQALVGKYSGSLETLCAGMNCDNGLTLEILSVKGDTVTGTAERFGHSDCVGQYSVSGTVKGDTLKLRQTKKGGVTGDCGMFLKLTVEGPKLVGTMNKRFEIELSK